eukprot:CAMPEP_0185769960 /NCGR_PEP_ID=MMETSP1174-20130828/56759_1 /TAXON_ID=35687 /ORGANISM="Dictyocha speculum, Strain CCMP1381" /LENGTH=271 /DNA_ID=CAMNT_0028455225 /DNA_START=68 /DNA_END=880 /DNA_ORIENTATION=+
MSIKVDAFGMSSAIVNVLELLEAATLMKRRAPRAPSVEEITAAFSKDESLRVAQRASVRGHMQKIVHMKDNMEKLESSLLCDAFPTHLKEAMGTAIADPQNTGVVETAWSKITSHADAQNLMASFSTIVMSCRNHLKSPEGVRSYLVLDLNAHLLFAENSRPIGLTKSTLREAATLMKVMEEQIEVRSNLEVALDANDAELLKKATAVAQASQNDTLEVYARAISRLEELCPSMFNQLFGLFGDKEQNIGEAARQEAPLRWSLEKSECRVW